MMTDEIKLLAKLAAEIDNGCGPCISGFSTDFINTFKLPPFLVNVYLDTLNTYSKYEKFIYIRDENKIETAY